MNFALKNVFLSDNDVAQRTLAYPPRRRHPTCRRGGKIMVTFAIMLPVILSVLGLLFDGGLLMRDHRSTQNVADAAAMTAAVELQLGNSTDDAIDAAELFVVDQIGYGDADVTVAIPPSSGTYAGRTGYVEVTITRMYQSRIIRLVSDVAQYDYSARAVAGLETATAPTALHILDPDPSELVIASLPTILPGPLALIAGFEIEGVGEVSVDGAVIVNTQWAGVDEDDNPVGDKWGPPYAASGMPLLPLTRLRARDIRVAGGVDYVDNYAHFEDGEASPLDANRLPIADPFETLEIPSITSDPDNVDPTEYGGVTVLNLAPIGPATTLRPGVYDWIQVIAGQVVFEQGVYIIRDAHPITGISLNFAAGKVTAEGVMFYVTDSPGFNAETGSPDVNDSIDTPPAPTVGAVIPSVVIAGTLINSKITPLNDPGSPFHGMSIFQRRNDRRPLVIAHQNLILGGEFGGQVYAKYGHATLVANGTYDASFAVGTMRIVTVANSSITPSNPLPAATDVFLVE